VTGMTGIVLSVSEIQSAMRRETDHDAI